MSPVVKELNKWFKSESFPSPHAPPSSSLSSPCLQLILLVTTRSSSLLGILTWQPSAPLCSVAFALWVYKDVWMGVYLSRCVTARVAQSSVSTSIQCMHESLQCAFWGALPYSQQEGWFFNSFYFSTQTLNLHLCNRLKYATLKLNLWFTAAYLLIQ